MDYQKWCKMAKITLKVLSKQKQCPFTHSHNSHAKEYTPKPHNNNKTSELCINTCKTYSINKNGKRSHLTITKITTTTITIVTTMTITIATTISKTV
jgi:hypothetical protein